MGKRDQPGDEARYWLVLESTNGRYVSPHRTVEHAREILADRLRGGLPLESATVVGALLLDPQDQVVETHGDPPRLDEPPRFPPLRSVRYGVRCVRCQRVTMTGVFQFDHRTCPTCTYEHVDLEPRPARLTEGAEWR